MHIKNNKLHFGTSSAQYLAKRHGTPLYVYELGTLRRQYRLLTGSIPWKKLEIHYACKANSHIGILRALRRLGSHVEAVSRGEIEQAFRAGFKPSQIIYTSTSVTDDELLYVARKGVRINIDSLSQLKRYARFKPRGRIGIRINQGIGSGRHSHVITGGPESKFGIYHTQLPQAISLSKKLRLAIIGVHQHIGSNILDGRITLEAMRALLKTVRELKGLEYVDFGGGFGVPYRPGERPLDMKQLGAKMGILFERFCKEYGKELMMALEPGRYLVAEAGTLLAKVTEIKTTPFKTFVGVNSGFNHLLRPALYGSYHHIVNASRMAGPKQKASIAGNICESGDLFAKDRIMTRFRENDIVAILTTGAYGFSMSSTYNSRKQPKEIIIT
jgi:diaminopimelate decarboxylase